jgi:hypothetical protein
MQKKSDIRALQKEIEEKEKLLRYQQSFNSTSATSNRSRAITVGPAGCGIVEVILRSDTHMLWHQLQPVEAIELIESIAAAVGVYVATKPKDDYASWRDWSTEKIISSGSDMSWRGALASPTASSGLRLDNPVNATKSLPQQVENNE